MITLIEALNYRCFRYISQPLGPFHIMVGPNGSGKSSFLDIIAFIGDLVSKGLEKAIQSRTPNFYDLVWGREGGNFELAMEAEFPTSYQQVDKMLRMSYQTVRYEVGIGLEKENNKIGIMAEQLFLIGTEIESGDNHKSVRVVKPDKLHDSIITNHVLARGYKPIIEKNKDYGDIFHSEVWPEGEVQSIFTFQLGSQESALTHLPRDEKMFPVATWLKDFLRDGVQMLVLNTQSIHIPSPPGSGYKIRPDGSGLPWAIKMLKTGKQYERMISRPPEALNIEILKPKRGINPEFREWIAHLKTALPDLKNIKIIVRPEDRHAYLMLVYQNGLEVPSWVASDGTLRTLALTLPAYVPDFKGILLVEEPENGVHPRALETIYQSLTSIYSGQVLVATHSPVLLNMAELNQVLCFSKDKDGSIKIISGDQHPMLKEWKGEVSLGTLFAGGVLD